MKRNEKTNLKLLAKNQEDLKVISAYIQDSLVTIKNIVFLKKNRIFIMIIDRFMWENIDRDTLSEKKRIRSAIKFDEVLKVKSKEINQKNLNKRFEFLAIKSRKILDNNYEVKIFFSGGSVITLILESIEIVMHDLGEAWNVKHIPTHKI